MRVFVIAGAALIVLAAAVVPLPWSVVEPASLVGAAEAVELSIDPQLDRVAGVTDRAVTGAYLTVRHHQRAAAARLLVALVDPGASVAPGGPVAPAGDVDPVVAATMAGLGIVPRFADLSELPVTARVADGVDPAALGVALHAFDVGSQLDLAAGRTILGLGRVTENGALRCPPGLSASLQAAVAGEIDIVLVPSGCAAQAADSMPDDARFALHDAGLLTDAADTLLARP